MRNICMVVSYDGTNYSGFQSQPKGRTIQDELEKALRRLTGEDVRIEGSGRTDAGVHARGQVVNFLTASQIPIGSWAVAMNNWLPVDIVIRNAEEVPAEFHARHSAKRKTYRYTIGMGPHPDVFARRYQFHHYRPLDVGAMREGWGHFCGTHDFTSFTSIHSTKKSHVRTIYEAWMEETGDGVLHFYVTGSGFLYNMVRIMMGTMIFIGEGKRKPSDIPDILAAMDRSKAGPKAMAHGLMLWEVDYSSPRAES